jgi:hypothetical protein
MHLRKKKTHKSPDLSRATSVQSGRPKILGFCHIKVGSHEGDRRISLVLIFVPGYGRLYGMKYL